MRIAPLLLAALAAASFACEAKDSGPPSGAALLFDVRFDTPEEKPGSPPRGHEPGATKAVPSPVVSRIFMGAPRVVASLCGLAKQPLELSTASGTNGHSGVELQLDRLYGRHHVELSTCVERIGPPVRATQEPQLAIFLDFPSAYAVGFFADGRIGLVDPARASDGTRFIGTWSPGVPLRVAIDADIERKSWKIALDGKPAYEGAAELHVPRGVRVVLRGNQANVVALDDVVIWAERDLSAESGETADPPTPGTD